MVRGDIYKRCFKSICLLFLLGWLSVDWGRRVGKSGGEVSGGRVARLVVVGGRRDCKSMKMSGKLKLINIILI